MKTRLLAAAGTFAVLMPQFPTAIAQEVASQADAVALQERIDEQEQRLKILERRLEIQGEAATSAAASAAQVRASATRFSLQSADGANSIRLRGTLHFDGQWFGGDSAPETADTWVLRRVRPTIEGTLGSIFDYRFTPDFGNSKTIILDAYVAARLQPWLTVQAGKFKVPVGLERLVSANDLRFIIRGFPTALVPNRDLGVQLTGDVAGGVANYSLGYFNGVTDGGSSDGNTPPDVENDTAGDLAARVFFQPFLNSDLFGLRGLGVGVAGTYVNSTGSGTNTLLPSYKTSAQTFFAYRSNTATGTTPNNATFADGRRLRLTPQLYYYRGRLGILSEYVEVSQDVSRVVGATTRSDRLKHSAWQAQFSWFLTGEEETFRGFTPNSTFKVGGPGWGAFEVVARVQGIDFDNAAFTGGANSFANPATSVSGSIGWGVGLNWYLHNGVKWSINYDQFQFDGGAVSGDRPSENALFTRIALSF